MKLFKHPGNQRWVREGSKVANFMTRDLLTEAFDLRNLRGAIERLLSSG